MNTYLASAKRRYRRLKAKADAELSFALSGCGHLADFIAFDRTAEQQQRALTRIEALENLESGTAWTR